MALKISRDKWERGYGDPDGRLKARVAELEAALRPFAKFAEAMTLLRGNHPKSGDFYTLRVTDDPVSLTVEDFKAAAAALSP